MIILVRCTLFCLCFNHLAFNWYTLCHTVYIYKLSVNIFFCFWLFSSTQQSFGSIGCHGCLGFVDRRSLLSVMALFLTTHCGRHSVQRCSCWRLTVLPVICAWFSCPLHCLALVFTKHRHAIGQYCRRFLSRWTILLHCSTGIVVFMAYFVRDYFVLPGKTFILLSAIC